MSGPRRSAGVPNRSGTKVLYTTSTYSFETHKKTTELRILEVATGDSHQLTKDDEISDFNWLNNNEFACLQAEKDGTTSVYVARLTKLAGSAEPGITRYIAGTVDAAAGNLKVYPLDTEGNGFAVVLSAQACSDGSLFSKEKAAKKTHSTGRLYTGLYVRHWDRYETEEKNALWFGKLARSKKDAKYELSKLMNALKGTGLECPIRPFGGSDNFDLRQNMIIFVAKDTDLNPALNTKTNVYLLHINSWTQQCDPTHFQKVIVEGYEGAKTCPIFAPEGTKGAFLAMKKNGYEADRNEIFVIANVNGDQAKPEVRAERLITVTAEQRTAWDRSPASITFSANGQRLIASAEECGYGKLYMIDIEPGTEPRPLIEKGYVSNAQALEDGRIFISGSSIIDSSWYVIIEPLEPPYSHVSNSAVILWSHSNSAAGSKYGLKASQVSSIWTPASNPKINKEVHSIIMKPSNFKEGKKYPVAYLIHGGPQGSWADSWSTRWNPAVFAEQGYIVIAPNPTGSTGYGQAFTDAINKNWGGDPYQDIVNVFEWVGKHMSEADNDNAVALGASYGGYMMNWIQGHDLGRKFKALVCHDGIFSFAGGLLATEELYFPFHDLGGTPWFDPGFEAAKDSQGVLEKAHQNFGAATFSDWRKWDPSEHLANWSTPQLIIHSSKDYRLTISEGLAAFNVLQARGVDSQFLTFPDENHWVLKPENSLVWHKVVLNWINKYSGLSPYATEHPSSEEFWGGIRSDEEIVEMPGMGKPET